MLANRTQIDPAIAHRVPLPIVTVDPEERLETTVSPLGHAAGLD
jgi:hypothetical protein